MPGSIVALFPVSGKTFFKRRRFHRRSIGKFRISKGVSLYFPKRIKYFIFLYNIILF